MNAEQQRIAIAEACGFEPPFTERMTSCGCDGQWDLYDANGRRIPDFLNDLNAIHEAEKTLKRHQWVEYKAHLDELIPEIDDAAFTLSRIIHATAAQRSEAFLKTLGLWKEEA